MLGGRAGGRRASVAWVCECENLLDSERVQVDREASLNDDDGATDARALNLNAGEWAK